ncbi:hypothetical protein ES705_31593 [subsurface metagenome]
MSKRKWIEIVVYFDDNMVQILRRKDFESSTTDVLKLQALYAVKELGDTLNELLGEAEV